MKMLYTRLYHLKMEEERAKQAELKNTQKAIDFGSQIRSYVLQPYTKVKDHRTDTEVGDTQRVLDGGIEPFIQAYLRYAGKAQ